MASAVENERPLPGAEPGGQSPRLDDPVGQRQEPRHIGTEAPLDVREMRPMRGRLPGTRYVRVTRSSAGGFERRGPGRLVATERVLRPRGPAGQVFEGLRGLLIGARIATERELHERIGVGKGLAVFASDNISSSAYATEEIMRVLALAGTGALALTMPITLLIVAVLATVVTSYQQTIRAYPNGGGSYIVASDNLGPLPGLTAAAALLTDYILTVSVSIAAGVAALTSIFPGLFEQRVAIGVFFVVILCLGNLRGIRESATIFAAPTYVYLLAIFGLLAYGFFLFATGNLPHYQAPPEWHAVQGGEALGLLLLLRAFASGSVALTGTEAVSNGVPAFQPPESRHARTVLVLMGSFFGTIFLAMSFFSAQLGILPDPSEQQTVVSQLAATLVGDGSPYHYLIQLSTALLLVLAANTAFADFPRLASILAKDRYLPQQFQHRGDRLAFSSGIFVLSFVAALLIVAFGGSVTNLIPLYTVGVFLAFTLSQTGMVLHWYRRRGQELGWRRRLLFNGLGAVATGIVTLVVAVAKFALGAWMVLLIIPVLILIMLGIQRHYVHMERALSLELPAELPEAPLPRPQPPRVLVPISRLDRAALQALAFARSISPDVSAVHIADDQQEAEQMNQGWAQWGGGVPLAIVDSPYRSLIPPLLGYIDALDKQRRRPLTVVLPEFVPRHFWEYVLHNQTAARLKFHLFFRPNTVVIDVPYRVPGEGRREGAGEKPAD
ncbi:MAG: APC family permease [Chloroflexi bacterium]|nr:APC family permease [Bacteroidota bacterium]MCL5109879.1 APC family permease [Chloroflexota bacterium]